MKRVSRIGTKFVTIGRDEDDIPTTRSRGTGKNEIVMTKVVLAASPQELEADRSMPLIKNR